MRIRERAADKGVGEHRDQAGHCEFAGIDEAASPQGVAGYERQQHHASERHWIVQTVDGGEAALAVLLARGTHVDNKVGRVALYDAVCVPDRINHALAGVHVDQLPSGGNDSSLDLQQRVFGKTGENNVLHFLTEASEAPELVEYRASQNH